MSTTGLSCKNVWKVYGASAEREYARLSSQYDDPAALSSALRQAGQIVAVGGVSFNVAPGEMFVIMGLSGSGKSTVVRCLTRLIEPSDGEVSLDGANLLAMSNSDLMEVRRKRFGMVFQHFGLMPHLSVLDNICLPMRIQGADPARTVERAREVIDLVGLNGRENNYPRQLSGGQQQRVGIARSLAIDPQVWFLDEPFSALDPLIRRQMQDEFLRLQRTLKKTIVFITHDFLEALKLADRVAIMKDGEVVQIGTPADLVLRPVNGYVREFTEDVPRAKVLTAGDIAEPGKAGNGMTVQANDCLDDVMHAFENGADGANVVAPDGTMVGRLTARNIIHALSEH
ncbi:betaine/proline/choline family ABC transporter ATP-binding protein [Leisingera daeponensis]|uniref:Quaternary amine transport ATP-binding protein n=1 Tax=Leisingera daeponensis TaxID=405746 RepID=A0ABS7NIP7_9RHOB|nr:betaine/proline/choline family ABC transporter ATP-binding protein [Leisingera daeponensis]MBY6141073.1 betaine/proline/choline family ABC transporter ATP-binding protein [Leisingera daeponensis]